MERPCDALWHGHPGLDDQFVAGGWPALPWALVVCSALTASFRISLAVLPGAQEDSPTLTANSKSFKCPLWFQSCTDVSIR